MSFKPNTNRILNMDYASLYPTVFRDVYDERMRLKRRRKKLDKILNNINDR